MIHSTKLLGDFLAQVLDLGGCLPRVLILHAAQLLLKLVFARIEFRPLMTHERWGW